MARSWRSVSQVTALIGRDDEACVIRDAVLAARQGKGSLLLVLGEAGVGKTRLMTECCDVAGKAGMAVLRSRAVEASGPLRAVAEALLSRLRDDTDDNFRERAELRPFRSALGRLLPGWADTAATAEVAAGTDPIVISGRGRLSLAPPHRQGHRLRAGD